MKPSQEKPFMLSVVTPAYHEAENLPHLHARLCSVLDGITAQWEWIVVDDHSQDETPRVLEKMSSLDPRIRVIRLARNHGAYTAIACGLRHACGDAAVVISADLQDPPEVIPQLVEAWQTGAKVVWAARRRRAADSAAQRVTAGLVHGVLRRLPGLRQLPEGGADFFLLDRVVVGALAQCDERSVNLTALISWMGFSQTSVSYDRGARLHGQSGWNLDKKINYALDSVTAFSFMPIRIMSYFGVLVAMCGFSGALYVMLRAWEGTPVRGYPSLMVAILVLGGMQMVMLGVLGEYLWRTYDEVRGRPRFIVEKTLNVSDVESANPAEVSRLQNSTPALELPSSAITSSNAIFRETAVNAKC